MVRTFCYPVVRPDGYSRGPSRRLSREPSAGGYQLSRRLLAGVYLITREPLTGWGLLLSREPLAFLYPEKTLAGGFLVSR